MTGVQTCALPIYAEQESYARFNTQNQVIMFIEIKNLAAIKGGNSDGGTGGYNSGDPDEETGPSTGG